ncbi:MAG: carboxypeptidase-like regulatory domain-containing protein [Acidobacteria bacterium]|nr:carboxypeptidase-like regulatory domain-containing protein [Acidobacteriota bacterium]
MKSSVLFVILALPAAAQLRPLPEAAQAEVAPQTDGVITAKVVDARGRPIAGAWVVLKGYIGARGATESSHQGTSNAGGQVRFSSLPNGHYRFEVQMAGYRHERAGGSDAQLNGPEAEQEVELLLLRRPVMKGRVVDGRGEPMYNATVNVLMRTRVDGVESVVQQASARTDDRGVYRITLPDPGRYWLMATHMEASFPRGSAPHPTGVTFYPNSPDLLTAAAVEVRPDQPETAFDIMLTNAPDTQISARIVSGSGGGPCIRCRYSLRRAEGSFNYELVGGGTARTGGFQYTGLPAGRYVIYVEDGRGSSGWWATAEANMVEGRPVALVIETSPPTYLSGRVKLEGPPVQVLEANRERDDAVQISLEARGRPFFHAPSEALSVQLKLDEREFELGPLPPEKFRVEARVLGGGGYLSGLSLAERPVDSPLLDFSQAGGWSNLELTVRFDLATIDIRVAGEEDSGEQRSIRTLVLVPDARENPFGQGLIGRCYEGRCQASSVRPGRYWAVIVPGAVQSTGGAGRFGYPGQAGPLGEGDRRRARGEPTNRNRNGTGRCRQGNGRVLTLPETDADV